MEDETQDRTRGLESNRMIRIHSIYSRNQRFQTPSPFRRTR
jgi:hypothetical protein